MGVTRRGLAVAAAAALGLLPLAACGGDDAEPAVTGTTAAGGEESTTTTAAGGGEAVEVQTVDVTAADYSYDTGGEVSLTPGLVRFDLTNTSTAEVHHITIVQLDEGVDLGAFGAAAASDPSGAAALDLATTFGGPNAVAPGASGSAVADLAAGDYLMMCFIPSPADGVPHAAKGMVLPFTVAEGDSAGDELAADEVAATVGLSEFRFDIPDGFDGQGTIALENRGQQAHEMAFYKLNDGATLDDALAVFAGTAPPGPPPFESAGGLSATAPGSTGYADLDLAPGEYAVVCFLPDVSGDKAPHFTHGMAQQLTIG
jgi:hypothetical protein